MEGPSTWTTPERDSYDEWDEEDDSLTPSNHATKELCWKGQNRGQSFLCDVHENITFGMLWGAGSSLF